MLILVDSSVWIDSFRNLELPHVNLLNSLIAQNEKIAICGVILTEVLLGIREERQFIKVAARLQTLIYLDLTRTHLVTAAQIYRTLRYHGLTIRKPIDCMITPLAGVLSLRTSINGHEAMWVRTEDWRFLKDCQS